ncbi:GerMN domain-containing protein [Micromonospora echinofusca]|uniref:GerMN domain-containing protein n=1 Tax=Micromonospora echinofusca TaxID=47858 RepID=A0ABS3VR45_MICEH|nr:GerMN domain-containing protein [Micromonospora echinofusca]MBO4207009.1 hypothetical protein [Micromonospora echinofusca]
MSRRPLALLTVVAVLAGCGVPTDEGPRVVQPPPGPFAFPGPVEPTATGTGAGVGETLCLVRDDRLVPVRRRADRPSTPQEQLGHLLAGPSAAERDRGLGSALPGAVTTASVTVTGTAARVVVDEAGGETGRSDEVLAYGQIVCTLTDGPDVTTVSFVRDGSPLEVPRADGSLSTEPLTRADYVPLISPS